MNNSEDEEKYNDISEYVDNPEKDIDMEVINQKIEKERERKSNRKKVIDQNYTFFDYEDIDEELEDDKEFNSYITFKDLEIEDKITDLKDED